MRPLFGSSHQVYIFTVSKKSRTGYAQAAAARRDGVMHKGDLTAQIRKALDSVNFLGNKSYSKVDFYFDAGGRRHGCGL